VYNIGLVLSGGMAKGAYQIGALQAISEMFIPTDFKYVSAASVGALNSYAFLTYGLDTWIDVWKGFDSKNERKWVASLLKSDNLYKIIRKILSENEIENTFYIPLVNIKKRKLLYADVSRMHMQEIETYLRASVAVPVFNSSVLIGDEYFFDGAMVDNIPIQPIFQHKVDFLICIYFDNYNYTFENEHLDNKIIKINFADDKFVSNSLSFTKDSIKYMMDEGYAKAQRILQNVFENGPADLPAIYAKIEAMNAAHSNKNLRITGDIIVNNMNKIAKKFFNRIEVI
jgi:predicted acylesterase/phospholipase RssA